MDSDENGLNNLTLNEGNEGKTSDTTFYQLLEKQAKEFELFGQRLKSEIQNSYQELVKLQQEQSIKSAQEYQTTNHEINTNFPKSQQIITEITKLGNSQSELIESLKARVEELEIESIVKNQDINNLRQDIKNFLEFNKSKINKKSDIKGKSIEIVNENENYNLKDYEGAIWADSSSNRSDESSNWENNVEDENLVNNLKSLKSTHAESSNSNSNSNSSSNHLSSFPSQINIHIKIQEIITRRENLGKNVRVKDFKILERDFTSDDLIQYTKSENYNSLNNNIKRIINNYLIKDESLNVEDKIHFKIQEIISRRDNFDKRIRERHFKILTLEFTSNDLIQYTKSENYKSLNDNIKRMINNSFIKRWANEDLNRLNRLNRENREDFKTDDDGGKTIVQQIHVKIQDIIIRREKLGKTVKRRNLRFLSRDFTSDDLIQYTKSGKFKSLNKKIKKIVRELISSSETTNNTFSLQINSIFQENQETTTPLLENLHSQIQQMVTQKEQLGYRVRLKHFKTLETFFTINDFIQYTKTNQFNSLDSNSKRLLDLLIYEILTRDFNCQNVILSQNLDEYVKRGVIPELPLGYNNYTEYKGSEMFNKLNKFLKERVHKLIKLEKGQEQMNVMNVNVKPSNGKPSKPSRRKNTNVVEKLLHLKLL